MRSTDVLLILTVLCVSAFVTGKTIYISNGTSKNLGL